MTGNPGSISLLLQQTRTDRDASEKLFARLLLDLQRRFPQRPSLEQSHSDREDAIQSGLRDLWRMTSEGQLPVENREGLYALLWTIVDRRYKRRLEESSRKKRGGGMRRQVVTDDSKSTPVTGEMTALANEMINLLPVDQQEIVLLTLSGFEQKEIAAELGVSTRTVIRKLNHVRQHWMNEL